MKPYTLIQSYVRDHYFVSTAFRQCSSVEYQGWYFETMVWEWDKETKLRGKLIDQQDSGVTDGAAITHHCDICFALCVAQKAA